MLRAPRAPMAAQCLHGATAPPAQKEPLLNSEFQMFLLKVKPWAGGREEK